MKQYLLLTTVSACLFITIEKWGDNKSIVSCGKGSFLHDQKNEGSSQANCSHVVGGLATLCGISQRKRRHVKFINEKN